jgi:hypothetical protein
MSLFRTRRWNPFPLSSTALVWKFTWTLIHAIGDVSSFYVYLRGTTIHVTPDYVSRVLGVPIVPHPYYPFTSGTVLEKDTMMTCFCSNDTRWLP